MRPTSNHNPHHPLSGIIACALAALLLALPLLGAAQTPEPTDSGTQSVIQVETEPPAPTPTATMPPLTPTAPPPTATPTPAPPTQTPAAETPPASPTATPTTTASPTDTPTGKTLVNTDSITATTDTSGITLQPGEEREIAFSYQVTTPRTSTVIHAELRTSNGNPATGWILAAQAGPSNAGGASASVDLTESSTVTPGSAFPVTFAIQAPADAAAEQTISLYVTSTATTVDGIETGLSGDAPAATMTVVPAPDMGASKGSGFSVQSVSSSGICAQAPGSSDVVKHPSAVTFDCASNGGLLQNLLSLKLSYRIKVTNVSDNWEFRLDNQSGYNRNDVIFPGRMVADLLTGPPAFSIELRPTSAAPPNSTGTVTVSVEGCTLLPGACLSGWTLIQDSVTTLTAHTPPLCPPTVSLTTDVNDVALKFETSTWDGDSYPAVPGTLNMNLTEDTRSGCSGLSDKWDVDMQMSGLYQDGDTVNGFFISAGDITYQSITPNGGGSSSDAPPLTLNGSSLGPGSTSADALGSWDVNFQLQPPSNAPTDDYSGTITVTIGTGS